MGSEEDLATELIHSMINFVREFHKEAIDKAYEYFWEENYPEDFLRGDALGIAFVNFEDWLIFNYKVNDAKETFIDLYIRAQKELKDDAVALLTKMKDTVMSLYEVLSVGQGDEVVLNDLLMDGTHTFTHKTLAGGLKRGDLFATRLLPLDGKTIMGSCVYPFTEENRTAVLEVIDKEFHRYRKNENPQGTMRDFLKQYSEIFNVVWVYCIRKKEP